MIEPLVSKTYAAMAKVNPTEQDKFKIYTQSRIIDFDSWKKSNSKVFREFLAQQRQKSFPTINAIYYQQKVDYVCQILDELPESNNTVILVDIEIFDDMCSRIETCY